MFREYNTDFNIQFGSLSGSVIDHNVNYYAEDDADYAYVWDEDDCIATLCRDADEWIVERVSPFYAINDPDIESDTFGEVMDFVNRLEKIVEAV